MILVYMIVLRLLMMPMNIIMMMMTMNIIMMRITMNMTMMIITQVEVCGDTLVGSDKDNNLFFKTHTSSDVKGDDDDDDDDDEGDDDHHRTIALLKIIIAMIANYSSRPTQALISKV